MTDIQFGDDELADAYDIIDELILKHRAPRSGPIWLTQMPDILRAVGLNVVEYDGWQARARSSGGYTDWPLCVMWHHTASNPSSDGKPDCDYMCNGSPDKPIANLYIQRNGTVWVLAAGATNTNGKGNGIAFSRGTVPDDRMNARAVGVEMANNGVGERWPQVQIDSMFRVSNVLNVWFGNVPDDLCTHQFYAPDRKIDPATSNVEGNWVPSTVNASGSWNRTDIQTEAWRRIAEFIPPEPAPPSETYDMATCIMTVPGRNAQFIGTGTRNPDGSVHCVLITWLGPGGNLFVDDHTNAPDTVIQETLPGVFQRDLVFVGDVNEINDSLWDWTEADFYRVVGS